MLGEHEKSLSITSRRRVIYKLFSHMWCEILVTALSIRNTSLPQWIPVEFQTKWPFKIWWEERKCISNPSHSPWPLPFPQPTLLVAQGGPCKGREIKLIELLSLGYLFTISKTVTLKPVLVLNQINKYIYSQLKFPSVFYSTNMHS